MLNARPYPVEVIDAKDTSRVCHRCGGEVKTYGKRDRLVKCPKCGLRDFSRDLNAARNLARIFSSCS